MKTEFIIILLGRIVQVAVMVLTLRVMTAHLMPDQVGVVGVLTSTAAMFVWLLSSPVANYVTRHTYSWWMGCTFVRNYFLFVVYVAAVAILSLPVTLLWSVTVSHSGSIGEATVVALYLFFSVTGPGLVAALNILNHRLSFVVLTSLVQLLCLGLSYLAVMGHPLGSLWVLGQAGGFAIGLVLAVVFLLKNAKLGPATLSGLGAMEVVTRQGYVTRALPRLKRVFMFSAPLILGGGFYWLQFLGYRIVISNLVSLEFLGLFFAGYSVSAGLFGMIDTIANQFVAPYFYKHLEQHPGSGMYDYWAAYVSTILPIMFVIGVAAVAFSVPASHLLLGPKFWSASDYVAIGAVVECLRLVGAAFGLAGQASKKTIYLVPPFGLGALSLVAFLVGGVHFWGQPAIGPAMIAAAIVFVVAMVVIMRRLTRAKFYLFGWYEALSCAALLVLLSRIIPVAARAGIAGDVLILMVAGCVVLAACALVLRRARLIFTHIGTSRAD